MEKAQYLLSHTCISLKDMATKLGYCHVRQLPAEFKSFKVSLF
jgi:AraC-like DNA-binding protein